MSKVIAFLLFILLAFTAVGQTVIPGVFRESDQTFVPLENISSSTPIYKVGKFNGDYGIITREIYSGVINKEGKVLVPLNYRHLELIPNDPNHFIFSEGEDVGIVALGGIEVLRTARKVTYSHCDNDSFASFKRPTEVMITPSQYPGCVIVKDPCYFGFYNIEKRKMVVPMKCVIGHFFNDRYERTRQRNFYLAFTGAIAVGRTEEGIVAFHVQTGQESMACQEIEVLDNGSFFMWLPDGKKVITKDPFTLQPAFEADIVDYYHNYCLFQNNGRFGICDGTGAVQIPAEYDDIQFYSHEHVWVKKAGKWAMCSFQNEISSPFEYLDIERSNEELLKSIVHLARMDTLHQAFWSRANPNNDEYIYQDFKSFLYAIRKLRNRHLLYSTFLEDINDPCYFIAKKEAGYCRIYTPLNEHYPDVFHSIYYVPKFIGGNVFMGFSDGKKCGFGVLGKYKYDELIFLMDDPLFICDREAYAKKGKLYIRVVNYSGRIDHNSNCYYTYKCPLSAYSNY